MANRALCFGINNYPGTDSDLSGCVNDANDWADALTARAFQVTNILDAAATKATMVQSIGELLASAKAGETCVITYSGHGTWEPDQGSDEPDGRDEGLCPHDIDKVGALLDDEIRVLFAQRAAGVRLVLLSDSCHSGSVTRGDESDVDPGMPRARFLPPAVWLPKAKLAGASSPKSPATSGLATAGSDLLLAGCTDLQYSWDTSFGGRPNGAFTFYALKTLKKLPAKGTYEAWFKAIRDYLPSTRLPQNPQLKGPKKMRTSSALA